MNRPLCPECFERWSAWLDYKHVEPVQLVQVGKSTPRRMAEEREARYRKWRDVVTSQQEIIRSNCAKNHGASNGDEEDGGT